MARDRRIVNREQASASRSDGRGAPCLEAAICWPTASARMTREEIAGVRRRPPPMPDGWSPISPRCCVSRTTRRSSRGRGPRGAWPARRARRRRGSTAGACSPPPGSSAGPTSCMALAVSGGGGVGGLAAPDPAFRPPLAGRHAQPGPRASTGPNLGIGGGPGSAFEGSDGLDLARRGPGTRRLARASAAGRRNSCRTPRGAASPPLPGPALALVPAARRGAPRPAPACAWSSRTSGSSHAVDFRSSDALLARARTTGPQGNRARAGPSLHDGHDGLSDSPSASRSTSGRPYDRRPWAPDAAGPLAGRAGDPVEAHGGRERHDENATSRSGSPGWAWRLRWAATLPTLEANLLAGRSGVDLVTASRPTDYPSRIAAQVAPFPAHRAMTRPAFAALPRLEQAAALVRRVRPPRRRLLGPASRPAGRAGAGHRGRVDAALGGRHAARRQPARRPRPGRESTLDRVRRAARAHRARP